ncbi:MAG: hypothetical protein AAFR61_27710 [Bacteroidota bacterium]
MKKTLNLSLLCLLFLGFILPAQAQEIIEGPRPFMKKESANGLSMVLEGQAKNVEAVMERLFNTGTNSKGKLRSGLRSYEGARVSRLSSNTMDVFYKVEKSGRGNTNKSRVTVFLSTGNGNFMNSTDYPDEMTSAKEMMEEFQWEVNVYELELAIQEQNKVIDKAIKVHDKMVKDSVGLEKKLAETQQAIEDNKIGRANQLVEIDDQKKKAIEFQEELQRMKEMGPRGAMKAVEEEMNEAEEGTEEGGTEEGGGGR